MSITSDQEDRAGGFNVARPVPTPPSTAEPELDALDLAQRPRRGWLIGLVLAVLAIAIVAFVVRRGDSQPTPTPTSTQPTATPTLTGVPVEKQLTWAPPPLVRPITVKVSSANRKLHLDPLRDYRIVLPPTPITLKGGLVIEGGHNVVLIGGEVAVPSAASAPLPVQRRGLYLKDQTGILHIEGVRLSGQLSEGIDLDQQRGATVQLENIAVERVTGSYLGNHADVVQVWAGPNIFRIDGLQAETTYQGFFLLPNQLYSGPAPQSYDLRRIVINSTPDAAYLLWTDKNPTWLQARDIQLVAPGRDDLTRMLRPLSAWEAAVTLNGSDPNAVLPAGTPGAGYMTPGYAAQPTPTIGSSP